MKKTLAILVFLCFVVCIASAKIRSSLDYLEADYTNIEFSLSPNSIEYIDFPNAHEKEGAYASTSSKNGFGFGVELTQREGIKMLGWGVDVDMFILPTYTEYGRFRVDATLLAKVGLCFGKKTEVSLAIATGFKLIASEYAWFAPVLGAEAKVIAPIVDNFWIGFKVLGDFTAFFAKDELYDNDVSTFASYIVLSWRLK